MTRRQLLSRTHGPLQTPASACQGFFRHAASLSAYGEWANTVRNCLFILSIEILRNYGNGIQDTDRPYAWRRYTGLSEPDNEWQATAWQWIMRHPGPGKESVQEVTEIIFTMTSIVRLVKLWESLPTSPCLSSLTGTKISKNNKVSSNIQLYCVALSWHSVNGIECNSGGECIDSSQYPIQLESATIQLIGICVLNVGNQNLELINVNLVR